MDFQTWAPVFGSFTPVLPKNFSELLRERSPFNAIMGNTRDEGSPFSINHFHFHPNIQNTNNITIL